MQLTHSTRLVLPIVLLLSAVPVTAGSVSVFPNVTCTKDEPEECRKKLLNPFLALVSDHGIQASSDYSALDGLTRTPVHNTETHDVVRLQVTGDNFVTEAINEENIACAPAQHHSWLNPLTWLLWRRNKPAHAELELTLDEQERIPGTPAYVAKLQRWEEERRARAEQQQRELNNRAEEARKKQATRPQQGQPQRRVGSYRTTTSNTAFKVGGALSSAAEHSSDPEEHAKQCTIGGSNDLSAY